MPSVLVTGANGFLGSAVCRTLLESGMLVRGLTRTKDTFLEPGVTRFLAADLTDDRALRPALDGADAVIHLAGRAHVVDTDDVKSEIAFQRANVDGTQAVLDAAVRAGVRRLLFTSSIKIMGPYAGRPWTEDDVPAPTDAYGRSKLAAERLLSQAATAGNIELGIVRLPLVYGPGVKANMLQLFRLVDAGVPLPFKNTVNRRSIVYSKNVAAALSTLLAAARLENATFFVTDAEAVSTPSLIRMIGRALGRPSRLFGAPPRSLAFVARLGDSLGRNVQVPFNSHALERLTASLECSPARIASTLGYSPPWATSEAIAETARWYSQKGRQGNGA